MYVMHARNIVSGLPYTQTGYIPQPELPVEFAARSYPSGYPLLLAPFYALFGFDLRLFKLLNAALLVLSLWPIYLFARRTLPAFSSLLLIVALGFSTLYLAFYNAIGSDAPYQLASFLALLLLLRIYDRRLNETSPWKWGLLAGLCTAAAYLIRPIGLALPLAVAGTELWRKRRITPFLIALLTAFLPPLLLNNLLLHKDNSYAPQFNFSIPRIASHAASYIGFFSYAFANPLSSSFRYLLWGATLLLALLAIARRLKAGLSVTELYMFTVFSVLSVYWVANQIYLLCIMPIYMVYIFEGFGILLARVPRRLVSNAAIRPLRAAAAALVLFAPAATAVLMRPDPNNTLVTAPNFEELCAAVRRETPPQAFIVFWNPRVMAFSTGRPSSGWPIDVPPERVVTYLQRIHPDYVVADKSHPDDRRFLIPALAAPLHLVTVLENQRFTLMRVLDAPAQ